MFSTGHIEINNVPYLYRLFVRICNDGIINVNNEDMTLLGEKFGCESKIEAKNLVDFIKNIGMSLHGFSFHSGSPCRDTLAVVRGIEKCKKLIKYARSIGCQDAKIIDIGGGFIGLNLQHLEDVTNFTFLLLIIKKITFFFAIRLKI